MVVVREDWLALTKEDPLEPNLPICDPHHHLWDRPGNTYLIDQYLSDTTSGHRITETVYVEARSEYRKEGPKEMLPVGETEFVVSVTRKYGVTNVAAGIVGFADLTLGTAVAPVLEAHIEAGKGHFRGIRFSCPSDPSPEIPAGNRSPKMLLDPKIREGAAGLKKYNLSFDAYIYHTQLMELVDFARSLPEITIILNHCGGPLSIGPYANRRDEIYQEWKRGMRALAVCPNVNIKVGGLGMPRFSFRWDEQATPPHSEEVAKKVAPYYLYCIEQFGVERCMFESNFPDDKESYSFVVCWNAYKRLTKGFSPKERAALFHDTAAKVYRLETQH